ncbi:MAG: heme ABC transporter permease [Gammaproteobacteria bacterium]|nr:heme ABC transporter permease [Gammaproteobacteria bacterium]
MWTWFHKLGSPPYAYRLACLLQPWLFWLATALMAIGAYGGLFVAPTDYQMGDAFRILYIHAPAAYMSMAIYVIMAITSAIGMIWRIKLAFAIAAASAPLGAWFTALALASGAIWGQPMWGTWWVWDARLTSELILLFLYFGYMGLRSAYDDPNQADRASGIIAIVGVVNVPIIKFSVDWWNTLHQPATISKLDNPSITADMLWPLLVMIVAFNLFYGAVLMNRFRCEILNRERNARWLPELL